MKQHKKIHTVKKIILVMTVFSIILSMGMFSTSANNSSDTNGVYSVGGYAWTWTDAARLKTDYTSSYQKCVSSNVTYYSWVYASNLSYPKTLQDLLSHPTNPSNGKITPSYAFSTGVTRYMVNYVKENKYDKAGMMFWTGSTTTGKTHIYWSPDSV